MQILIHLLLLLFVFAVERMWSVASSAFTSATLTPKVLNVRFTQTELAEIQTSSQCSYCGGNKKSEDARCKGCGASS